MNLYLEREIWVQVDAIEALARSPVCVGDVDVILTFAYLSTPPNASQCPESSMVEGLW